MDGIIIVNKEVNMSSHDVIYKLRRILKTKKIGHCGTLDPLASGVLVCLVNKATKLSNYLVLDTKEYITTFKLGVATTSQDLAGEVVESVEYKNDISEEQLLKTLKSFEGEQIQLPSIYSAIKVNGKKLYEYARSNQHVEIPSRKINIFSIELIDFKHDLVKIKVNCSSGTYIRTLCYDIAKALNYPGVVVALQRTRSGNFSIEDSTTLNEIENNQFQLISIEQALKDYPIYEVSDDLINDIKNGKPLNVEYNSDFIVKSNKDVVAIYEASINGISKIKRGLW